MNRKNSLLLPPQFFETDSDKKIRTILDLGVDALYLFDHFKNPADSTKPTYIFTEEIFSLYNKVKNEIEVGVCVLNVNCLLYTSPSPRDMRRSRMPSSA